MTSIAELRRACQPAGLDLCLYRRLVVRPVSIHLTRLFLALGMGADAVSVIKGITACAGAALFGFRPLPAALLLQLSFILDACDGEVARFTGSCRRAKGEFIDKLGDVGARSLFHISWGVGACISGAGWPAAAAGAVVAGLWLTARFCAVETLLESFSNHSGSEGSPEEKAALERLFVRHPGSGRVEHLLSLLVHPWVNLALAAALLSRLTVRGVSGLSLALALYTLLWLANTVRKVISLSGVMDFRRPEP